ncbi:MAG: hypothetical protein HW421_844 [Ignavibacteria bacterium]|nr:hypothetical protein [Ignavibacteria bacterium]
MKKVLVFLFISAFVLRCSNTNGPTNKKDCNYSDTISSPFPTKIFENQRISPDGEKIAYNVSKRYIEILHLKTGKISQYNIISRLPSNVRFLGVGYNEWCPYNPNRLLVHCATSTDLVGDGKKYSYGQNLYLLSIIDSELKCITPIKYGKAGADGLPFPIWLSGSNENYDSLHFIAHYVGKDLGIFIPQTQEWIKSSYNDFYLQSKKSKHILGFKPSQIIDSGSYYIDNKKIITTENISILNCASFSPNEKYLALSLQADSATRAKPNRKFTEIWIIDVEKYLANYPKPAEVKVINILYEFCMITIAGSVEFITDNTLAVSMRHIGELTENIWEISVDGQLIRNLTNE